MIKTNHSNLEVLFREHAQQLVHFLKRKVGSQEEAEDIAQNAFIRIQRLAETSEMDNPKAYLYRTASNLLVDTKRRHKLEENYKHATQTADQFTEHEASRFCNAISPEQLLIAKSELETVNNAIKSLPNNCRQAFLMHRLNGYSYSDIAEIMGVSVSSVEKYILQAIRHSRKVLNKSTF